MGKKFATGLLIGGATAFLTWKSLSTEKKQRLRSQVQRGWGETMDVATDYAMDFLDWADGVAADYQLAANEKWAAAKAQVKQQANRVADHFSNEDFDEETAEIRDALSNAKDSHDNQDDIVIDMKHDGEEDK
ncbi:YtxH domain-containing protein [uncultured Limosilactobacillus sp.]|uniref:YtxH domain-containing protein n=1 Tax=uncultured Limosilactobacillus sp. TaxID=2837629 RepID=UPI0025F2C5B5|nr:YtxH domain-containing protein [uncultured Limosilactobacillus sp.]